MAGFRGRVQRGSEKGPAQVEVADEALAINARKPRRTVIRSVTAELAVPPAETSSKSPAPEPSSTAAVEDVVIEPDHAPVDAPVHVDDEPEPSEPPDWDQLSFDDLEEAASISPAVPDIEDEQPPVAAPAEPVRAVPVLDDDVRRQLADLVASFDWSNPDQRDPEPVVSIIKNPKKFVFDAPFDPVTEAAIHGHVLMSACQSPYGSRPVALDERWGVFSNLTRRIRPVVRLVAQAHHACLLPPSGWIPVAAHVGRAINHHLKLDRYVPSAVAAEHEWDLSDPLDAVFDLTSRAIAARKQQEMSAVLDSVGSLSIPADHHGSVVVDAIKLRKDDTNLAGVPQADLAAAEDLWQANRVALQGVGGAALAERLAAFLARTASTAAQDGTAAA